MLNQSTDYQNVCIARPLLPNLRTKYRYRYLPVWPFRGARGESRHRHAVPPQIIAGSGLPPPLRYVTLCNLARGWVGPDNGPDYGYLPLPEAAVEHGQANYR